MIEKWKVKDFSIKAYRHGSRLRGGCEWLYEIIWNGKSIKDGFTRKADALNYVRKLVNIQHRGIEILKEQQEQTAAGRVKPAERIEQCRK